MKKIFTFLFIFVFSLPFIKVDKSLFVIVYEKENDFLVYPVAIGDNQTNTKEGIFKITGKSINPRWYFENKIYPPYIENKENALGIRWIALSWITYGIHGTNDPFSIGKNVSLGCVRLQNDDVEVLYEKVNVGDEVLIYSSEIEEDLSKSISLLLNFYDLKKFIVRESH